MLSKPLSEPEFADALRRGQGRALMHVQQYGLSGVADRVLDACLENQVYDQQCEPSRAAWLFSMFYGRAEYASLSAKILTALQGDLGDNDAEQLCELAVLMAKAGNLAAAAALRSYVLGQSFALSNSQNGCAALVALDGVDAVLELARRFGPYVNSEDEWAIPVVEAWVDDPAVLLQAKDRLTMFAAVEPAVKAYWELCRRQQATPEGPKESRESIRAQARARSRQDLPLNRIVESALAGAEQNRFMFRQFGSYAPADELDVVFQLFKIESNPDTLLRLLWIFAKAPMPELHPKLWQLVQADDAQLRGAALTALAQIRDPQVADFARDQLQASASRICDLELLQLFVKNYQPSDVALLLSMLSRLSMDAHIHGGGCTVVDIATDNASMDVQSLLAWVYETTPCTVCRRRALTQMAMRHTPPADILAECQFDADPETRQLAEKYISADHSSAANPE